VVSSNYPIIKGETVMCEKYELAVIGQVKVSNGAYQLQIEKEYIPALTGLDGFNTLTVLWWANLLDSDEARAVLTCSRPYKQAPEEMGIFATRSPVRPNPICVTAVSVLHIDHENGKIAVAYIDAEDGTPLLDIKPYFPATDRVRDVTVPEWCRAWPQWVEESAAFDWESVFENAC
jgi:tRNA-Thr(GGU) m(6)t(6)A37 methyltransferase TsaA